MGETNEKNAPIPEFSREEVSKACEREQKPQEGTRAAPRFASVQRGGRRKSSRVTNSIKSETLETNEKNAPILELSQEEVSKAREREQKPQEGTRAAPRFVSVQYTRKERNRSERKVNN